MGPTKEAEEIPVYMFMGFLESGKTTFANETLIDRGFTEGEPTLLLVCEEGIEEYDEEYLKSQNIFVEYLEESNLNTEYLLDLQDKYKPTRVMIEYNGTWKMDKLFSIRVPKGWTIVQVITFVDASTFDVYVANMKAMMMEQLSSADMIIFNRCNEELRKALRGRNLRMVNRRADIYLENTDGTSEDYVTDDMAPFDLSGGKLDVPDDDYGIWYVDMMDNPQRYDGITVRYKALMCHSKKFPGIHCPGRFAMVCCNNDMQFLALVCKGQELEKFKNRQWVEIQATVKKEKCQAYDGEGPVLYVTDVKPCQKPDPENVSF